MKKFRKKYKTPKFRSYCYTNRVWNLHGPCMEGWDYPKFIEFKNFKNNRRNGIQIDILS